MMDTLLNRFYRQYLQQVSNLTYPSSQLFGHPDIQQQLYRYFFDETQNPHLPPPEYQRKVLKKLIAEIEKEVEDEDDEISDHLMEHMGYLSSLPKQLDLDRAQEPRVLSYFVPDTPKADTTTSTFDASYDSVQSSTSIADRVLIREAPQLWAAGANVGHRTWEACLRLAYYLCTSSVRSSMKHANILELGAGTGLLSLICSMNLGSQNVIATDGLTHVVNGIEENIILNSDYMSSKPHACRMPLARILDWTDVPNLDDVLSINREELDIDYILGADITYHPELLEPLASLISKLRDRFTTCKVFISFTVRNENTLNLWRQTCENHGLTIHDINEEEDQWKCPPYWLQTGLFHEQAFPIVIMDITK